ncbi:MAG: flap endonuclease [Actinomycetota bacterium]|nr:flap endonuclease [Actinomycetota bacterium]
MTLDGTGSQVPLLLVDGHNLLWGATFGFPAPIYSRDKTRLFTGLFAFFALLRVAIRDDVPGAAAEVIVIFDGEHGAASRQQAHEDYKASRPADDQALAPLHFLPDVKRGLDHCGRKLVTPHEVYTRHQVTPTQWADFRALAGDAADEIPGVRGIGAKTAATLLGGGLTLDDLPCSGRLATGRARAVAEQFELALKWRDMIRLNTGLELPWWPTGHASPPLPHPADVVDQLGLW